MKTIMQIAFILISSIGCSSFVAGHGYLFTPEERKDGVIIKCENTVDKCILVVTNELKILVEHSGNVIADLGLSPAQLISVTIESDLQKNKPELWRSIPAEYREKLAGALIIEHKGKIEIK